MASMEPYLGPRQRYCYKSAACDLDRRVPCPGCPNPSLDPNCFEPDIHKQIFAERWKLLRQNPCNRSRFSEVGCSHLNERSKTASQYCAPELYDDGKSVYTKDYKYPLSALNIEDCCPADCHCDDKFPELPGNVTYRCWGPRPPMEPMDDMTSHRYWFPPKPVPPPSKRHRIQKWDPCECPMECATVSRLEYYPKKPIPNGPALASILKNGVWSASQLLKGFTDETTTKKEFGEKYGFRPPAISNKTTLRSGCGPLSSESETKAEYIPKEIECVPFPEWLENDQWLAPMTPQEKCTTYKHYYRPYPFPPVLSTYKVQTPEAIPFCTLNKICYSCHDPCVDQRVPVEMKDADPWPYVKPCPIKYQDNLHTDPCAPFRDHTTYKESYYAKDRCFPLESFAPLPIYAPSLQPFNDDTTNRVSYPAYNWCQYKESKVNAGNPNGIQWGPYTCPPNQDKCLPTFAIPYGNPLKPYIRRCPCGPYDDRPTYKQDFKFRTCEMVAKEHDDLCERPEVTPGGSLYRYDYVKQGGKKAEVMPPPTGKGYRCMNPSSIRDTNTLSRLDFNDFWKTMSRADLELYRGKPTIRTRVGGKGGEQVSMSTQPEDMEEGDIIYQPVIVRKPGKGRETIPSCQRDAPNSSATLSRPDLDLEAIDPAESRRCKEYREDSGQTILNIPRLPNKKFGVRDGYAGVRY